ncbi:LTA synthase family protein [Bordetella sp. BOR01]|uniref:LTA synthase family protein n=1 Tax=Bordetella sp. BOR01 TaxID=2854779 RepID=UPI001C488FC6|nr:LTA synthase family protein [Bordetella sp. BOR01]MBV7482901.1 LTA synthase family protein [Bordetella sp. BOR01]
MRHSTLLFIIAAYVLLTGSRLALAAWQWRRVRKAGGLKPILLGGLRIDTNQIAVLVALPAVLSPWLGHLPWAAVATGIWLQVCWILLGFLEVATPAFIQEYDTRPNRLFVEYLKHPREVSGMLWRGYKLELVGALVSVVVLLAIGHALFGNPTPGARWAWWQMGLGSLGSLAAVILAIRGTLGHRPINPSTVAYSNDGMLNTLPLNSLYNVFYAIYSMKYEKSAAAVYGKMPGARMQEVVLSCAGLPDPPALDTHPSVHHQAPSRTRTRPANIVIILEESLGAQYSAALGGANLTPHLDALARESWAFTRAYATGTRSVRGLEAVTAGFLPTPAQAVLKLPAAQRGFFTLADVLGRHGYHSRFIYGGESHFDNMKAFFLGNGFDEIVDRPDFTNPAFVGTWGASDEDMFTQLDARLRTDGDRPSFTLAFSVSNHSPWEYPAGRIEVDGNPATVENTVRYADWALGQFFERARQAPYWNDTVFLVVADHDSRVFGDTLVPVRHFHIPAVILGGGIEARRDEGIISQIDLPPTLLSLAGVACTHPMLGRDLTRGNPDRAIMQYENHYGYLKGDDLLVLLPGKAPVQFRYAMPAGYAPADTDPVLAEEALAHALWPSWAYREERYCVPREAQPS